MRKSILVGLLVVCTPGLAFPQQPAPPNPPRPAEILAGLLLESVIQRDPEHFGAHHFYVHLMDTSPNPQYALASAAALRHLAPGSGHIVHMGGHIFLTVGDLEMAALLNEQAVEADRKLFERFPPSDVYAFLYYGHNLHFIMRARAEQRRCEDARRAVDSLMILEERAIKTMPMAADYYLANRMFLFLRFFRWDDILVEPHLRTRAW